MSLTEAPERNGPEAPAAAPGEFELGEDDFQALRRLVRERTGINLKEDRRDLLYNRLSRRLRALNLGSFTEYRQYVSSPRGEAELAHFVNALTTNLTSFFREPHHFEHLEETVMPGLREKLRDGGRVRLWSAACSRGHEAYSMALVLGANLPERADARILATDIDTECLEEGRRALYPCDETDRIPEKWRPAIGHMSDQTCRMPGWVRRYIAFKHLNLFHEWPMSGPFDVIFCRNTLIYFQERDQTRLVKAFHGVLAPGGHLYLGHSESRAVAGCEHLFEKAAPSTYRKRSGT